MTRKTRLKHLRAIVPPWLGEITAGTVTESTMLAALDKHEGSREKYWDDHAVKAVWFGHSVTYREVDVRSTQLESMVNNAKQYVEVPASRVEVWDALITGGRFAVVVEFILLAIKRGGYLLPADFRRSSGGAYQYLRFCDGGPSYYPCTWSAYHRLHPKDGILIRRWWRSLNDARKAEMIDKLTAYGLVTCQLSGLPIFQSNHYGYYESSELSPPNGVADKQLLEDMTHMVYCRNSNKYYDDRDYDIIEYVTWCFSRREDLHEWEDGTLHDVPDPSGELTGYHSERRDDGDIQPYDLGVENEVKFLTSYRRKQAVRTMQSRLGMICERDSSLCSGTGVEIVQRKPKSLEDTIAEWTPVLGLIPAQTCLGYGMHVNICSDGWERDQLANFVGFWSINEDFVKYISKRRYGHYCGKAAPLSKEPRDKLYDSYNKYRACCVHGDSRVEVRIFRGTHSLELFSARCQIVDAVARWADEIDCSMKAVSQINGPGDSLLNYMKDNESRYESAIKCVRNWVKLRTRTGVLDADGMYIEPPPPPTPPTPFHGSRPVEEDGVLRGCMPVMVGDALACPLPSIDLGYFVDANQVAFFYERSGNRTPAYQVPYAMRTNGSMHLSGVHHDPAYMFGTWETIGHMNGCPVMRWVPRVDASQPQVPTYGPIMDEATVISNDTWDAFHTMINGSWTVGIPQEEEEEN